MGGTHKVKIESITGHWFGTTVSVDGKSFCCQKVTIVLEVRQPAKVLLELPTCALNFEADMGLQAEETLDPERTADARGCAERQAKSGTAWPVGRELPKTNA